jgi:tyrosyl-tRNA synthetase
MESIFEEFTWRGLIQDATPDVVERLSAGPLTLYAGFDPTADSLHVGNLLPLLGLVRFQRAGHRPIALAGGGTGLIGDPSGKASERRLLDAERIAANVTAIEKILARYLEFDGAHAARVVNNIEWLGKMSAIKFLRDTGKHFTINAMLGKESVSRRLETGISFTEFSYMLLQARDYLELFDGFGCQLQIGGSDQWGNITAGVELIRRVRGAAAFGLTMPLITKADGTKFGKTENGAVWLTEDRTSPYEFYQFWFNAEDASVIRYLKSFTFLSRDEIAALEIATRESPERREAQRTLAWEMTTFIHGAAAAAQAVQASRILFGEAFTDISPETALSIFREAPSTDVPRSLFEADGALVADLMTATKLASSKGDARRTIEGGGVYFNNVRVASATERITSDRLIGGQYGVLRKGAKTYHLVRVVT